ncbi:hypothetical protein HK103_003645 [Boothiomyces macroporosus]|uniref:NAD(+) kinase n=1 Tax=Boothiomyces macroporosus TaxID=261099 RepID=A0AAD5Y685_9FUNG|nr:hypothetical protein HK103_003645 [Boothiomyces macroporosus]
MEQQFLNIISPISSSLNNLIYEFEQPEPAPEIIKRRPPSPIRRTKSPRLIYKRRMSSHSNLAKTSVGLRELAKKIGQAPLTWESPPKRVLIVTKISDSSLTQMAVDVSSWLLRLGMIVYIEKPLYESYCTIPGADSIEIHEYKKEKGDNFLFWDAEFCATRGADEIDFVITFGGDGTVLFAAWLFQQKVPPIIPFNLGSLGFLTVFGKEGMVNTIQGLIENEKVLNDLVVDRGPSPFLSKLELYGNNSHLTTVQADGLVIATPTGSTAYSLSAGGSVVHPDVSAILVTPICPHTLSFRPMILPDTMDIRILVPEDSRCTAWVSFDGRHRVHLTAGDSIQIVASQFPVPTVCLVEQSEDWFHGLETCLAWNKRERQKSLYKSM